MNRIAVVALLIAGVAGGVLGVRFYQASGARLEPDLAGPDAEIAGEEIAEPEPAGSAVDFSRYADIPKVDVHVHLPPTMSRSAMALYRQHNVVVAINASGGSPSRGLAASVEAGVRNPGLYAYCFLNWQDVGTEQWNPTQALDECKAMGAVGVKISKGLGLGYVIDGELLAVDDPRLDEAFDYMGTLDLPVLIHTGDPRAFFEPPTEDNERFEELDAHPSWSFHGPRPDGGEWPSWRQLLSQFENRVARHPGTEFLGAHFGNAPEDLEFVGRMLRENDNLYIETGARVPEIGRHDPEELRAFFVEFQDRILFGTDFQVGPGGRLVLGSVGREPDTLARVPEFYESHWRFFETRDEDFEHPSPIQGDWTIDGIGLEREVLVKIYQTNALALFGLTLPGEDAATEMEN